MLRRELKGTQTRDKNVPATDGKPAVTAHAAVHGLSVPTKDSIVEVKIRFEGASMIDVEFDDRNYTGSHYGHICRAQVRLTGVTLIDERDGGMRNDIYAMNKDVSRKAKVAKLLAGRRVTYPAKLEKGKWYTFVVETAGDEMHVTLDGKPAGFLKSSGIGHATKSKIEPRRGRKGRLLRRHQGLERPRREDAVSTMSGSNTSTGTDSMPGGERSSRSGPRFWIPEWID